MISEVLIDPALVRSQWSNDPGGFAECLSEGKNLGIRFWFYSGDIEFMCEPGKEWAEAKRALDHLTRPHQWAALLAEDCLIDAESSEAFRAARLRNVLGRLGSHARLLSNSTNDESSISIDELKTCLSGQKQSRAIDFIDLKSQQDQIRPELERRIHRVLHHGQYILGPEVRELEARLETYVGSKHCITAASGTDTLLIALMALEIGPGDEVITVPYTWISTAEMIALIGAKPVFVDIDRSTYNIDVSQIEAAITPRTKAIMPVGIYGQCPDMDAINAIAEKHHLPVIEDAAQSFGATYKGKKSCALSTIGSTSFFPSKPLGGYGDGGALFTDDDQLAERMRQIRVHGQAKKHVHPVLGINGRCDTLQAAIVLAKMAIFDEECALRSAVGSRYTELFHARDPEGTLVHTPEVAEGNTSVFAQYTILVDKRESVQKALSEKGIPSVSYYVAPLHLQPVFESLGYNRGAFPVCEAISDTCLSLPMNPHLDAQTQETIVDTIVTTLSQTTKA